MVNHLATWACALSAGACAIAIARLIRFQRQAQDELRISLTVLNDTYREIWETVHTDFEWLEQRVRRLESLA